MYDTFHVSSATFSVHNNPVTLSHHDNYHHLTYPIYGSKTATICYHFATDHMPDYIHFTIHSHQLHFQCPKAQAIAAIYAKT